MDGADTLMPPTAPMAAAQHSVAATPRPTIGFPLGTALLLIVIFCLSGIFSCCYHWDKLRCLRRAAAGGGSGDPDDQQQQQQQQQASIAVLPMHGLHPSISFITTTTTTSPSKIPSKKQNHKQEKDQSLPVIMPGDQIPKYIAWPCPCPCPCPCQSTYNLPTTEKVLKEVVIHPSISPN